MRDSPRRSRFGRFGAAVRRFGLAVWRRDRSGQSGWSALRTRLARIATWTLRGFVVHELSVRAAALAYYTIFSIVPVLVVALWTLKLLNLIPHLMPAAPVGAIGSGENIPEVGASNNTLLHEALRAILEGVNRADRFRAGLAGLGALLYGVIRLIRHAQVALDTIAGTRGHPPRYRRLFGYLALLLLPPALLVVSGVVRRLGQAPLGERVTRAAEGVLRAVPALRSAASAVFGLAIVCLALTIFYASAARARIALRSSILGAAVAALLLAAVLWVFASFQIGAARAGALTSGMAALPVFLLWSFFSWLVILLGAQIAVAHERDEVLIHGGPDAHAELADLPRGSR
jgi:membrane protein